MTIKHTPRCNSWKFWIQFFQVSIKIELWMPLSIKQNIIQINHNISLKTNNFAFKVNKNNYMFLWNILYFLSYLSHLLYFIYYYYLSHLFLEEIKEFLGDPTRSICSVFVTDDCKHWWESNAPKTQRFFNKVYPQRVSQGLRSGQQVNIRVLPFVGPKGWRRLS